MLLLGRPASKILRAIVPAVDLLAGDLGKAIAAKLDLAPLLPLAEQGRIEDLVFHAGQGEVGEEGGAVDGDAGYDALLDEITS